MNGDADKTPPQSQDSFDEKAEIEEIILDVEKSINEYSNQV